eukprot:6355212-Alexandrium_andersonii.AAC.1
MAEFRNPKPGLNNPRPAPQSEPELQSKPELQSSPALQAGFAIQAGAAIHSGPPRTPVELGLRGEDRNPRDPRRPGACR